MLETIIAGVIAHGIYHYAMDIKHSDDETHHVPSVSRTVDNKDVSWSLKVVNLARRSNARIQSKDVKNCWRYSRC